MDKEAKLKARLDEILSAMTQWVDVDEAENRKMDIRFEDPATADKALYDLGIDRAHFEEVRERRKILRAHSACAGGFISPFSEWYRNVVLRSQISEESSYALNQTLVTVEYAIYKKFCKCPGCLIRAETIVRNLLSNDWTPCEYHDQEGRDTMGECLGAPDCNIRVPL